MLVIFQISVMLLIVLAEMKTALQKELNEKLFMLSIRVKEFFLNSLSCVLSYRREAMLFLLEMDLEMLRWLKDELTKLFSKSEF